MSALEAIIMVGAFGLSLAELWQNRRGFREVAKHWQIYALYLGLVGAGIALAALTLSGPKPEKQALAGMIWLMGWIFLVILRMGRALAARDPALANAPILRAPRWVDGGLLLIVLCGLAFYYGCGLFHICS